MSRPTFIQISDVALLHNLGIVKKYAPGRKVIAMVKANAYGCSIDKVAPVLAPEVDALGVACIEEALAIRRLGITRDCLLLQGVFQPEEMALAAEHNFHCVLHHETQLRWLLQNPQFKPLKVWVKVNTGMHRLGFAPAELYSILDVLARCRWVDRHIGLLTHMACADEPDNPVNQKQLAVWRDLVLPRSSMHCLSLANSAAIMSFPESHADAVRPGIMLYGVSPFAQQTGVEKGLIPVMRFMSALTAVKEVPVGGAVGYGGIWKANKPSRLGIVAAGYGDGYPRHIQPDTPVWIRGRRASIVGRVSMDMLTVDLSDCPEAQTGDEVELWGVHIPVELVAKSADTLAYELLCRFSPRGKYG